MSDLNSLKQVQVDKLNHIYRQYQDKLLQLTKKNRSILLKKLYNKHNFDLLDADELKPGIVKKIVNSAIRSSGSSINILLESDDSTKADFARAKLRTLERNLKQQEEETGQQIGYIGFPFLLGHLNDDFYVRGPIAFFPITLELKREARNRGWFVNISEKKPILNGALFTALKKIGQFQFPESYEETFDDLIEEVSQSNEEDLDSFFFTKINQWVKDLIPIDESINQNQIVRIDDIKGDDIANYEKQPFHLVNYKIIGNFPQADNEIFKDYAELMKKTYLLDGQIVNDLLEIRDLDLSQSTSEVTTENLDESKNIQLNLVLSSDSSQDEVILESKKTAILVVGGPPGTGKSQVIVNLVSDALTNGQKVLVVCQKRAALEVVNDRLAEVGLDRYVVFLEKEIDDRLKMYTKLSSIIEEEYISQSFSDIDLDGISTQIDSKTRFLSDLGKALSKDYFNGASAHKLYSIAKPGYERFLEFYLCEPETDFKNLSDYLEKIRYIELFFKKYEVEDFPWRGRNPFSLSATIEKSQLDNTLSELLSLLPNSLILPSRELQQELFALFDTHKNNPGFLKIHRKNAAKKINQILKSEVSDEFVAEKFDKVKNGLDFWNKFSTFLSLFSEKRRLEIVHTIMTVGQLESLLKSMQSTLKEFDSLVHYDIKKQEYPPNIFKILAQCRDKFPLGESWVERIEQEIYSYWIDKIERDNRILMGDPFADYESNRKALSQLLEKKERIVLNRIQYTIDNMVNPRDIYKKKKTADEARWSDFNKELKRKRKVMPVRKLFDKNREEFLNIAPCWLSSPESVSKIFPLQKDLFDLVIVDEASQLAAERALPFLYRAKRVVIAGDRQQLQPFDLFQVKEDEDIESESVAPAERSLLDLALVSSREIRLKWHYRSRYQNLINFSNHAFYNGTLNVVPNAKIDPDEPPIRWIPCNGIWENNTNMVEAEQVILEIKNTWKQKYSKTGKYPSIGVITFNEAQQDLISELLDKKRDVDPEFSQLWDAAHQGKKRNDMLFVKNIENVQGDERDVIIFSITYARGIDGKFDNRFGTLNQKGGENRLNVAITRSRDGMVIVCSIDPLIIKETSENPGPRLLRKFLEYAKATSLSNKVGQEEILSNLDTVMPESRKQTFDSEFEIQVYNRLERLGYSVAHHVGESGYIIDLAIFHPNDKNQYVLAIECDGATFHSAKSVKERDILRQKFLEGKGWKIERIWSRNWWKNPQKELDRISSRVNELIQQQSSKENRSFQKLSLKEQTLGNEFPPVDENSGIQDTEGSLPKQQFSATSAELQKTSREFDEILESILTPKNFESYLELLVLKILLDNDSIPLKELDQYLEEICRQEKGNMFKLDTTNIVNNLQNRNKVQIRDMTDHGSKQIRINPTLSEFEKSLLADRIAKKIQLYLIPQEYTIETDVEDVQISMRSYENEEDCRKQLQIIQKRLDANPYDGNLLYEKARFILLLGRQNEAIDLLDIALSFKPKLIEKLRRDVDFEMIKQHPKIKNRMKNF